MITSLLVPLTTLAIGLGPATEIPSDVTPGFPESSTPWVDQSGIHLTTTTGAGFVLSTTPAVVDHLYNVSTGEFEIENVCPIQEAAFGLSGSIVTQRKTVLVVAPGVGLIDVDPLTCDYDIVATGFLPPVDLGGGQFAPGLPNDVIADWSGNVYVSDSTFGTLYKWDGTSPTVTVLAQTPEMGRPDPQGVCQMPPDLAMFPFFGINGLRLSPLGNEILFLHTLPRGAMYGYNLHTGVVREIADFGCDVAPDEMQVFTNGDYLVSFAFEPVLGPDFSLQSLGSLNVVDRHTGAVEEKIAGPFTFSNGVTRTFGGPAAIHCLQWPFSNQCVVSNHYADLVGQPFEVFWMRFDEKTWPEARPN